MAVTGTNRKRKKLDQLVISDVPTLKAMADPLRLQILIELADHTRTVKEVAATLGVRPTRLYYHFKILEQSGLIRVVDRRMVSGIEERSYESVADSTTIAPEVIPSGVKSGVVGALLNVVRAELELALLSGSMVIGDPEGAVPILSMTALQLFPAEVEELQKRLMAIVEEFGNRSEPGEARRQYHAMLACYLAPSEVRRNAS